MSASQSSLPTRPGKVDDGLDVRHITPGRCGFAVHGNLFLAVWPGGATAETVERLAEVSAPFMAAHPGGVSALHYLRPGTPMPTSEARKGFAELMTLYGAQLGEIAVVLGGGGFWAGAVRGVLTGLRIATGVPLRVDVTLGQTLRWFPAQHERRTGVKLRPDTVQALIEELRDRAQ